MGVPLDECGYHSRWFFPAQLVHGAPHFQRYHA
jgi:hypothetical protein